MSTSESSPHHPCVLSTPERLVGGGGGLAIGRGATGWVDRGQAIHGIGLGNRVGQ